ncbi:hypothetical protein FRC00_002661, partial [Tulasnella sp. 408]
MELMLTGRNFSAKEAEQWGLVNRIVGEGEGQVVKEAVDLAQKIASKGQIAVQATKEMINAAGELPLTEGVRFERRLFFGLFSTNDKQEVYKYSRPISLLAPVAPFPTQSAMAADSTARFLVPVGEPRALPCETAMKLPAQDLFTNYVHNIHVIPGKIDLERFKSALSKAVARYPHKAGRLRREGDDWKIDLTDSPIPVLVSWIAPNPSELSESYPFPNDFNIQPDNLTQPFFNSEDCSKIFVTGDATDPLLGFKLTIWENGTAIGISWCHACSDAYSMWEFTRCLSAYYVDLDAPESALPLAPSFYRHFFRSPFSRGPEASDLTENFLPRMPHLAKDYELTSLWQKYEAQEAITNQVQLRLSGESLEKMFNEAKEADPSTSGGVKITVHDALSAYLIKALHKSQGKPMHTVILILN